MAEKFEPKKEFKNFIKDYIRGCVIKTINARLAVFVVFGVALIVLSYVFWTSSEFLYKISTSFPVPLRFSFLLPAKPSDAGVQIKQFSSEEDFKKYLGESAELQAQMIYTDGGLRRGFVELQAPTAMPSPLMAEEKAAVPERVSETTVQVPGIDEPDIVKTDGSQIYFSPGYTWGPMWELPFRGISWEEQERLESMEKIMPPYWEEPKTKVIKAFPPADLEVEAKIDKRGDLLLVKDILVVFSGREIYGYNVSNPKSPSEKWKIKLENNNTIVGTRLYKNKIYLVTKSGIDEIHPCPIKPLTIGEAALTIPCREIYHPVLPIPTDVVFVAMVLDPVSGKTEKNVSFVGSSGQSVVYMSEKGIYITYSYFESITKFFSDFIEEKLRDITPAWLGEKIKKLDSYDISQTSKLTELWSLWSKYLESLSGDEQLKIENEFSNRLKDFSEERKRDIEKSGIIKIDSEKFELTDTGSVPGHPLNQFALDEYNNYLRVAVTVGEGWWGWGWGFGFGRGESTNDVYVLDKNLKITGSVKDMGLTEKIYSVRFIEDKGYVVTFRETDPFYVLDLSKPQRPELKGELKIPGYSSYLHPITKKSILGIGKENWQVKISLFDVSSVEKPAEKDKYILDESWSDILNNYHAFLMDKKHDIFFLPGSKGGYIFTYKDNKLSLVRAVSGISARRAIYINDYLYIIGDNKITVLNEIDWEKINELEL